MHKFKKTAAALQDCRKDDLLTHKEWNPIVQAFMNKYAEEDGEESFLPTEDFIKMCCGDLGHSKKKARDTLDFVIEHGIATVESGNLRWQRLMTTKFVNVKGASWDYLANECGMSRMAAAAYLTLLNWTSAMDFWREKNGGNPSPIEFTIRGRGKYALLKRCGYSPDNSDARKKMRETLSKFKSDGILAASEPKPLVRYGKEVGTCIELHDMIEPGSKEVWVRMTREEAESWHASSTDPSGKLPTRRPQMEELGFQAMQLRTCVDNFTKAYEEVYG